MATSRIVLKRNKRKSNSEIPLYLRITKNRKAKFISLGYSILENDWDEKKDKVKRSNPNYARLNHFLSKKTAEAESISLELETTSKEISTAQIKKRILGQTLESKSKSAYRAQIKFQPKIFLLLKQWKDEFVKYENEGIDVTWSVFLMTMYKQRKNQNKDK